MVDIQSVVVDLTGKCTFDTFGVAYAPVVRPGFARFWGEPALFENLEQVGCVRRRLANRGSFSTVRPQGTHVPRSPVRARPPLVVRAERGASTAAKSAGLLRRLTATPHFASGVNQRRAPALENMGFWRALARAGG